MEISYLRRWSRAACLALLVVGWIWNAAPCQGLVADTAAADDPEVTELWVLTYIRSRVSSTTDANAASKPTTPDNVDQLVTALNTAFGAPGDEATDDDASDDDTLPKQQVVQRAGIGRLLLHGTESQVREIKRLLAVIDAPWPQVQMNLWAIQVSGSREEVAERVKNISEKVTSTRDQMAEVQRELARIVVRTDDKEEDPKHWSALDEQLSIAGVEIPHDVSLSLNETLLFLALHPRRGAKIPAIQDFVACRCGNMDKCTAEDKDKEKKRWDGCQIPEKGAFLRLADLFGPGSFEPDQRSFIRFRDALYCFKAKDPGPDAVGNLSRGGVMLDRVLKAVTDAFAADMNDLFFDPLLVEIRKLAPPTNKRDNGVSLVGKTRIVVTSGLEAGLEPEMASFVESGRPKPFGKELLDMAFPASKSGDTEDALTGSARILASLSNAQALGLAALLSAETEPVFTKVAPGIAVNIRPTVLPDGGAARLTIDARFGVESTPQDEDRTDIWRQAPPAGISSHHLRTDASVSAFDLFDLSSFSVTASHPQSPLYIPILGRLPLIGQAFQFPRRNKEVLFESMVLVNTVILPRAIELHRFYERQSTLPSNQEIVCGPQP